MGVGSHERAQPRRLGNCTRVDEFWIRAPRAGLAFYGGSRGWPSRVLSMRSPGLVQPREYA